MQLDPVVATGCGYIVVRPPVGTQPHQCILPGEGLSASLEMMTTGGCSCCHAWARHLREAGHDVAVEDLATGQLMKMKLDALAFADPTDTANGPVSETRWSRDTLFAMSAEKTRPAFSVIKRSGS